MSKKISIRITLATIAAIIVVVFCSSIKVIPTGYVGVRTTFGQINEEPVKEGFNWKIPFVQSIIKINTKQQDKLFEEQIWSESSERTAVYFENVSVTYSINGDKAAWIVANVSDYRNLISSDIVASSIKTAAKQLNSTDVTNRGKIEPLTKETLQKSVDNKYGEEVVYIYKVTISNIDFEEAYNAAIAEKQNVQLAYEKQSIINKQNIEAASAEAESQVMKAKGKAEAVKIEAAAEAEANSILSESINDSILANRFYDTWNGEMPKVYGSENNLLEIPIE